MGMGTQKGADLSVQPPAHGHFFRGSLRVKVNQDKRSAGPQPFPFRLRFRKGQSTASIKIRPIKLIIATGTPEAVSLMTEPAPGVPSG